MAAAESQRTAELRPAHVRVLSAFLLLLYGLGMAVQPPADGPDTGPTTWSDVLYWAVQAGLLVLLAGVVTGRSWALWAGLGTGALLLAQVVSCPLRGHHEFAPWWFAQLALAFLATALPAGLLRLTRPGAGPQAGVMAGKMTPVLRSEIVQRRSARDWSRA